MTRPARVPTAVRRKYQDAIRTIILAEDWPTEELPIHVKITDRRLARNWPPYWQLEVFAAVHSERLGNHVNGPIIVRIHDKEHGIERTQFCRRLAACTRAAWNEGIRRLEVHFFAPELDRYSAHERIDAAVQAAEWDRN